MQLWDEINPEKTKINCLLNKIEIIMEKKNSNQAWKKLESDSTTLENITS